MSKVTNCNTCGCEVSIIQSDESTGYYKPRTSKEDVELINRLWQMWKNLAEAGEIKMGPSFSKSYDELEKQIKNINNHS